MAEEIAVSSVTYNLAGDAAGRASYLKTLVVGSVLSPKSTNISETLTEGYLKGPGMRMRSFYNWAEDTTNYGLVGIPLGDITSAEAVDTVVMETALIAALGEQVWLTSTAIVTQGNPRYWAERWIRENRPADMTLDWTFSINSAGTEITIFFGEADIEIIPVTSPDYDASVWYVYAYYGVVSDDASAPIETGPTTNLGPGEEFPSTDGWVLVDDDAFDTVYQRTTIVSSTVTEVVAEIEIMHHMEDLFGDRSWRTDVQEVTRLISERDVFIYQMGTGTPALDALISDAIEYGDFFPFIPIRLDNEFLSETNLPDVFAQTTAAYKKATGGARLEDLVETLSDNPDLGDIDHAYVVFGVALNTADNSGLRYIYQFLNDLRASQIGGPDAYAEWLTSGEPTAPTNLTRIASADARKEGGSDALPFNYDIRIEWRFITEVTDSGLGKVDAKVGDLWFSQEGLTSVGDATAEVARLYWQHATDEFTYLETIGLIHYNYIYQTTAVQIRAFEALDDTNESGFIIPLHYGTWRDTSLVHSTQVATFCAYVVLNCFEVHEQQWYETLLFKIIVAVVVAVVSVAFTGGAGLGLLGTHLAVGTALGFTGMTAAIVGSVINSLAAMVLISLLEPLLAGLGPLGPIIGSVLMFAIGAAAGGITSPGAFSINWGELLRADNLIALTSAVGKGISIGIREDTLNLQNGIADYLEKANNEALKIQEAFLEEFGYGVGAIDPMRFVDSGLQPTNESSSTFLNRTLMTGSEIAEMSMELLYDFPKYSLTLPNAFT